MTISRGQMNRQLYNTGMMASAVGDESDDISMQLFGKPVKDLTPDEFRELQDEIERLMNKFRAQKEGGIMDIVPREQALFGGIKKAVKKVGKAAKKIVSSDIGKAALLAAGTYYAGGGNLFGLQRATPLGKFAFSQIPGAGIFAGKAANPLNTEIAMLTRAGKVAKGGGIGSMLTKGAALAGLSGFLSSQYGMTEEQQAEALRDPEQLKSYLRIYYTNMNPNAGSKEIEEFVANNSAEYTAGLGGYAEGGKVDPSKNAEKAAGIEGLPLRQNQAGVKELDLRKTGGFIQPVGIKEKADDIPAMLSNNEFVMTADAVKGAGGGDVRKGAQRMYDTMKRLEKRMA